jgi:hypothetical protein
MSHSIEIQKLVLAYFADMEISLILDVIDSFVYNQPTKSKKVSETITNFIKDMDIEDEYLRYLSQNDNKFFRDLSVVDLIENIKTGMLNMLFNRVKQDSIIKNKDKEPKTEKIVEVEVVDKKVTQELKKQIKTKNKNINFLKNELITIYERMTEYEYYFYGKDEDAKLIEKVKKI